MTNDEFQMTKEAPMTNDPMNARPTGLWGLGFGPSSAVTMQSEIRPALTLTLSPRRGNPQWPRREKSVISELSPALEKILPLPGGEGRGEGEREFQLNSFGLEIRHSSFLIRRRATPLCETRCLQETLDSD